MCTYTWVSDWWPNLNHAKIYCFFLEAYENIDFFFMRVRSSWSDWPVACFMWAHSTSTWTASVEFFSCMFIVVEFAGNWGEIDGLEKIKVRVESERRHHRVLEFKLCHSDFSQYRRWSWAKRFVGPNCQPFFLHTRHRPKKGQRAIFLSTFLTDWLHGKWHNRAGISPGEQWRTRRNDL